MARKGWKIVGLSVILLVPPASAQMRLTGLERLYFDHIAGPGQPLPKSLHIAPRQACGFRDPQEDDDWRSSWMRMAKAAQCITGKPGAKTTFRKLDAPSFIERGGGPE
jgi:hypothetical protein